MLGNKFINLKMGIGKESIIYPSFSILTKALENQIVGEVVSLYRSISPN